jgi:hypothetical protein
VTRGGQRRKSEAVVNWGKWERGIQENEKTLTIYLVETYKSHFTKIVPLDPHLKDTSNDIIF